MAWGSAGPRAPGVKIAVIATRNRLQILHVLGRISQLWWRIQSLWNTRITIG